MDFYVLHNKLWTFLLSREDFLLDLSLDLLRKTEGAHPPRGRNDQASLDLHQYDLVGAILNMSDKSSDKPSRKKATTTAESKKAEEAAQKTSPPVSDGASAATEGHSSEAYELRQSTSSSSAFSTCCH